MQVQLLKAHLKLTSPLLPFSKVNSGYVKLKAWLKEAELHIESSHFTGKGKIRRRHGLDQPPHPDLSAYLNATNNIPLANPETGILQVWCLEISLPCPSKEFSMDGIYRLILVCNNNETFRRVGTFGPDMFLYLEKVSKILDDRQFFSDSD